MSTTVLATTSQSPFSTRAALQPIHPKFTFNFRWPWTPDNSLKPTYRCSYECLFGVFTCSVDEYPKSYSFTLDLNIEGSASAFRFVKHCEIRSLTGMVLVTADEHMSMVFTACIKKKVIQIEQGCGEVVFLLSSLESWSLPPATTAAPAPSLGNSILENLFKDTSHDVFFEFESLDDNAMSDPEDSDGSATTLRPRNSTDMKFNSLPGRETTVGAHKLVLSQWPHFKAKFENQVPGDNKFKIENMSPKTFQLLLRFMYTGQLREDKKPKVTYIKGKLQGVEVVSWESLFRAAHEFKLGELCKLARDNILADLSPEKAIPFLFRTAFHYEILRDPVVEYVATRCGEQIDSEDCQQEYLGYPKSAEIYLELLRKLLQSVPRTDPSVSGSSEK